MRPCLIINSPAINYDFNKILYNVYLFLIWSKMFSEIGSLLQNSWPFYDGTSLLSVKPFFTHSTTFWALYPQDSGCQSPLFFTRNNTLWTLRGYKHSVPFFWTQANSADPDRTPQNAATDQGLHCLHTGISIKSRIKMKKYTRHP